MNDKINLYYKNFAMIIIHLLIKTNMVSTGIIIVLKKRQNYVLPHRCQDIRQEKDFQ